MTRRPVLDRIVASVLPIDYLTPDAAPCGAGLVPRLRRRIKHAGRASKRQLTGALRRSIPMVALLAAAGGAGWGTPRPVVLGW